MSGYIEEAQKERENWLSTLADSNSNNRLSNGQPADSFGGKSLGRTEINSGENIQLLCHKMRENRDLDPSEDSV